MVFTGNEMKNFVVKELFWFVSVCLLITYKEKVIIYVFSHECFKCSSDLCQVMSSHVQCINKGYPSVMLN